MFAAMSSRLILAAALGAAFLWSSPGQTQTPEPIGAFGEWSAYMYKDGDTDVCYMASQPKDAKGDYSERGDIWTLVTHRSQGETNGFISIIAGYKFKDGGSVAVSIGDKDFTLFTEGDKAWASTTEDDAKIITAMKAGAKMVVTGASWRGTETADTYSLEGFTKAYETIRKSCGL